MLAAYTSVMTANLTVSRLGASLGSLADLRRSGQPFGVPADSSVARYFRTSSGEFQLPGIVLALCLLGVEKCLRF
jgi:hypothetical protein